MNPALLSLLGAIAAASPPAGAPGKPPVPDEALGTPPIRLLREKVDITDGQSEAVTPAQYGGDGAVFNIVRISASYVLKNLSSKSVKVRMDVPTLTETSSTNIHYGDYRRFSMAIQGKQTVTPDAPPGALVRLYPRTDLWQQGLRDESLFALEQRRWLRWIDDEHAMVDLTRLGDKPNAVRSALAKLTELDDGQRVRLELLAKDQRSNKRQHGIDVTYATHPLLVTFGPGETLTVEIEATTARGLESTQYYSFAYLRALGARWHGTVGRSEVVLHTAAERDVMNYHLFPPDYRLGDGAVTWVLQDQEPTENIVVFVRGERE